MAEEVPPTANTSTSKRVLLIPVDQTEASARACHWAVEQFYKQGDEVYILHVVPNGERVFLHSDYYTLAEEVLYKDPEIAKELEENAKKVMGTNILPIFRANKVPYRLLVEHSNLDPTTIGALICKVAEDIDAAAIIMARHNKSNIQEFFVGSSTHHCTHHSHRPVVVINDAD